MRLIQKKEGRGKRGTAEYKRSDRMRRGVGFREQGGRLIQKMDGTG